jgi:hypothetical protein
VRWRKNKVPWIVAGVVIVLLAIGVVGFGGKKKSKGPKVPPETARALSLPVNRARTVVVPPCNTPVEQTTRSAARGQATPGATTLQVPAGSGVRYVLIPHCQPKAGVTSSPGNIPSAAFVLASGQRPPEGQGGSLSSDGVTARTQLILPNGSGASTVVVPPCTEKTAGKRDVVLGAEKAGSHTVVAPSC